MIPLGYRGHVRNSLRLTKVLKNLVRLPNYKQLVISKHSMKPCSLLAGGKGGRKG